MFFLIVLEYLKISDTPDMTKNHCFSSFMATRWPITWALLNKLDVLHLVLFNESDMFHLALFNKLYVLIKKEKWRNKGHIFQSVLFWSIWKFQIPRTWLKIIVFHHCFGVSENFRYPGHDQKSLFFIIYGNAMTDYVGFV